MFIRVTVTCSSLSIKMLAADRISIIVSSEGGSLSVSTDDSDCLETWRNYQGLAAYPCYLIQWHLNNTTECHKQLLSPAPSVDCLVTISFCGRLCLPVNSLMAARLSSTLLRFKMRRLLIAVGLPGPWTCSSWGKLMIRGVDTFSGLQSTLFPACGHLWPSEETEHITDHHNFILISTLWVQEHNKKHSCVSIVGD